MYMSIDSLESSHPLITVFSHIALEDWKRVKKTTVLSRQDPLRRRVPHHRNAIERKGILSLQDAVGWAPLDSPDESSRILLLSPKTVARFLRDEEPCTADLKTQEGRQPKTRVYREQQCILS
jgi:hypothetical protein